MLGRLHPKQGLLECGLSLEEFLPQAQLWDVPLLDK